MQDICQKIKKDLKNILSEHRYNHTLGVVEASKKLCIKYDEDVEKAEIASLLHDIAKQLKKDEIEDMVKKYDIKFDHIEKTNHQLKHAKIAKYIAKDIYCIKDEDILNSIEFHTTGRDNMSKLEIIICLSDYIEINRDFPGVDEIRRLSNISLELALYHALNQTIIHIASKNEVLHPDTLKARNYLLEKLGENIEKIRK